MALTATHLIVPLVILGLARRYLFKDRIPLWFVIVPSIFAAALDLDYAGDVLLHALGITGIAVHRVWTHSLIYPFLLLAGTGIVAAASKKRYFSKTCITMSKQDLSILLVFFAVAWFSHLALDCAMAGRVFLSLIPPGIHDGPFTFCPEWPDLRANAAMNAAIEGFVVILWFAYMTVYKKFKDAI